jgi:hypothetical protein
MLLACAYQAQKPSLSFDQKCPMLKLMDLKRFLRAKHPDRRHRDQPSSGRYHAAALESGYST